MQIIKKISSLNIEIRHGDNMIDFDINGDDFDPKDYNNLGRTLYDFPELITISDQEFKEFVELLEAVRKEYKERE